MGNYVNSGESKRWRLQQTSSTTEPTPSAQSSRNPGFPLNHSSPLSPRLKLEPILCWLLTTAMARTRNTVFSPVEGECLFGYLPYRFYYACTTPWRTSLLRPPYTDTYLLIKGEVRKAVSKSKAAGVLRLVFHDAGTFELDENSGGMNGSIIYELNRPENSGLMKSMKILEKAKKEVDRIKPVSWADMIAVAGAEAVSICGGPTIPVALGRLDTLRPDAEGNLPQESLDAFGLKQCFERKGLSTRELVALSGAHTLGSKGFGSPIVFDNSYYKILLQKPWMSSDGMSNMIGLPSDHALVEDDECSRWIKKYADNENLFFEDFKNAYVKLVNSGARWRSF